MYTNSYIHTYLYFSKQMYDNIIPCNFSIHLNRVDSVFEFKGIKLLKKLT